MGFVLVSVLLISLGLSGWHTLQQQEQQIVQETRQRGIDLARFSARSVVYGVVGYDYHAIQLLLDELVKSPDINYAKVTNQKGNVMARAGQLANNNVLWNFFQQDIIFDGSVVGELSLQLDNSQIIRKLDQQRDALIWREFILIILIAIGEFIALSYFIIRPIALISKTIEENIDDDGMITRDITYQSRDELGVLSSHFNTMRHRLNETTERLRSKIELADREVQEKNERLQLQSDELKLINEKLKKLTITDPLTELSNRRHFDILMKKELSFALRYEQPVSLVIFDLDLFKSINDKFGHSVGDSTLCMVARILNSNIRESDIAFRIGGEEFAVICRHTDMAEVRVISEKLRDKLEQNQLMVNGEQITVTASFGLMTYNYRPGHSVQPDDFYHCADLAMYHSKQKGRNRVTHYADILMDIPDEPSKPTLRRIT